MTDYVWPLVFVALCVVEGMYMGLQDRFGTGVWKGIRRYRSGHEPDFLIDQTFPERTGPEDRLSLLTSNYLLARRALPPPNGARLRS